MAEKTKQPKKKRKLWPWIVGVLVVLLVSAGVTLIFLFRARRDARLFRNADFFEKEGATAQALESYRALLKRHPDELGLQLGIVRVLTARKEFDEAEKELEKAVSMGLEEPEAARLKADMRRQRAMHRIESAGQALTTELCDSVIEEYLDPAIALMEENASLTKRADEAFTFLGDLYNYKMRIYNTYQLMLTQEVVLAQERNRPEEVAEKTRLLREMGPQIHATRNKAINTYRKAIDHNAEAVKPRVALARILLSQFIPRLGSAREVLEPLADKQPPLTEVLVLLGQIESLSGDHEKALERIAPLQRESGTPRYIRLFTGTLQLELKQWEEALATGEAVLNEDPSNPTAAYIKGKALLELNRPNEAVDSLQNIFSSQARHWPEARFTLARALQGANKPEQTIIAFRETLTDLDKTATSSVIDGVKRRRIRYDTCMILARLLKDEAPESAADFAGQAFTLAPDDPEAFKLVREIYPRAGREPALIQDVVFLHALQSARKEGPDAALAVIANEEAVSASPRIQLLKSQLLTRKGSYQEAVNILKALREGEPNNQAYTRELARLHLRLGQTAEARELYEELADHNPNDLDLLTLLIETMVRLGDVKGANQRLAEAESTLGADKIRPLRIGLFRQEGRTQDIIALTKKEIEAHPDDPGPQVYLAQLLWSEGDLKGARTAFDAALQMPQPPVYAYARAWLDLHEKRVDDAVNLLTQLTQKKPTYLPGRINLAIALQAAGESDKALKVFGSLGMKEDARSPQFDLAHWYMAVMHAGAGDLEAALKHNQAIIGQEISYTEERQPLLTLIANLDEPIRSETAFSLNFTFALSRAGFHEAAAEQLSAVVETLPENPLVKCWHTELIDRQGQHEKAVALYKTIIEQSPEFIQARISLARSHARKNETGEAIQTLVNALKTADPEHNGPLHFDLARLEHAEGNIDAAIAHYKAAAEKPTLAAVACNEAAWLLVTEKNNPSAALEYAVRAAELAGNTPTIQDTLGWVLHLNGDTEKAISHLETARQGRPTSPTIRYHLGAAYLKANRRSEAIAELKEALGLSETFPEAQATRALLAEAEKTE